MPFVLAKTSHGVIEVKITRNIVFLTPPTALRVSYPRTGILKQCRYLGDFHLDKADTNELQKIYPDFCFTYLSKFVRLPQLRNMDRFGPEDMVLMPETKYNKMPLTDFQMMNFFISNNQYSNWFKSTYKVLYETSIVDIPESMTEYEKLFDKNVLPIKKLVKDIDDLDDLTIKGRRQFFLYDDSNLIKDTFFTEINKKLQSYGLISLRYNSNSKNIINSKNRLKFNILKNISKEYLTLQLKDISTPKRIETVDSGIRNFSILASEKQNINIINEFKINGFQKFEQYMKTNPINIKVTDPVIQTQLLFYTKRYKYRFIANSLLFNSSIIKDTNVIFITANGLNNAKEILINGKLFQGIGVIYTSKIEHWEKIKTKSHWINVLLTDSNYPIAAKHFAFGFETTDLHNLLNFEFSLIDA